jgi:hypothetical protein
MARGRGMAGSFLGKGAPNSTMITVQKLAAALGVRLMEAQACC